MLSSWCYVVLLAFLPTLTQSKTTKECSCGYGGLCINSDENGEPVEPHCDLCKNVSGRFYESDCQTIVNHCEPNPCKRGHCVPTFGSYFCNCPPHYAGQKCQYAGEQALWQSHSNKVYVYYQVQTGRKGVRTPFYLVYDPGEQKEIRKGEETGVRIVIRISDGRNLFPIRRHNFMRLNVKRKCEDDAKNDPEILDIRVCTYLPDGDVWTFSFDPRFATFPEGHKLKFVHLPIGENGESRRVGVAGSVMIKIDWLLKGETKVGLFRQKYTLFTYLMSKVVHSCFPTIEFEGCSQNPEYPYSHLRKDRIRVTQITDHPQSCKGLRHVGHAWFMQRFPFVGLYDPVPTEIRDLDFSRTAIEFPRVFFPQGIHMIEYRLDMRGDPPIHGGVTPSSIYARCWIKVELGKMDVRVKGGNIRTMPCYNSLALTFFSANPSYELADMEFTTSCSEYTDPECELKTSEVPAIRRLTSPCEASYIYDVTITYQKIEIIEFQVHVIFVNTDVSFTVDCSFNCYPVDPSHRMIAVATIEPYITDTVSWDISTDVKSLSDKKEPEVPAFFPQSASRIIRINGNLFVNENSTTDFFAIATARMLNFTLDKYHLSAGIKSNSNNLKTLVDQFTIKQLWNSDETPTYRFLYKDSNSEPYFEYGPVTYKVFETNTLLRDSLRLVKTNYLTKVVFRPEWARIRLCIKDSSAVEACSEEHIVNLDHIDVSTIQSAAHLLSMIFYSEIGNQNENLAKFVEDDVLRDTSFPKLVDWANMRYTGLSVLFKITSWMKTFTEEEVKLTRYQYGDILDGLMRTWSLAHIQGFLILLGAEQYANKLGFEQWKGYLVKISKDDTRLLMEIILKLTQALAQTSRLFYGIRDVGTKHARAWTMRTTYQGILASFNRSRVGQSLLGYSDHVFGPTYPGNEWVALVNITLPDAGHAQYLLGRELCFTVFVIGSRPGDTQVSPTLFIDMRDVRGTVFSKLPNGHEYQVTLPVMLDGQLANKSEKFVYPSALVGPSKRDERFRKYNVYKYILPSVFERWDLTVLMKESVPVKVKVSYDGLPLYEEVASQKVLRLQWDEVYSAFIGDILLKPKTGENVLPTTFYVGVTLANPGMVKKERNDNLINCLCETFGFITAVPKFAEITQVILRDIGIIVPIEHPLKAYFLLIALTIIVVVILMIACIADFRRARQDALIYMADTYPQDKNLLVIGVYTGKNIISGTTSTVAIKIVGLSSTSRVRAFIRHYRILMGLSLTSFAIVHLLKSKKQRTLKSACDDWFVLTTKEPLGKIKSIYLWHDYRCLSNWYCNYILIHDIKQGTWYIANVERWFKLSPNVDESRMTVVQTSKLVSLESGLHASQNRFRNHYIIETRNSHPVVSLFCLHKRSLSSHEQKSLIFLIKCFAMCFWSWFAIEHVNNWIYKYDLALDEVEGQFGFNLHTIITCSSMALGSYIFTAPYSMIIKSTYSSKLIQKRTTNPMILEVIVPEHQVKTVTKEKDSSSRNESRQKVMFQLGPSEKLAETESLNKLGESKSVVKIKKATHVSPWKKFLRISFGPSQFRCVNISHKVFGLKMRKRLMIARLLAAIMLLVCGALILRLEKTTHLCIETNVCIILLIVALLLDSFVISPIITLFNSILSLVYLQTSNQEIYMWHEDTKISSPAPLALDEYISVATGKSYKPLLSDDIEKVEEKSLEYSFFRSLMFNSCIAAVLIVNMIILSDRYGVLAYHTTKTLIKAYNEGGKSPLEEINSNSVHLNYVENVKFPDQVETFVTLNVADLPSRWPNGKFISEDRKRWGKDLSSKVLGASSLLICFTSSTGMKMKIARLFTRFFQNGEGYLRQTGVEDQPVFLDENLLEFKQLDKTYTIRGVSGEEYNLHGHQAVMSVKDWSNYYVMLDSFLRELANLRDETPTPRAVLLTTNFLNAFTRRLITVDFLAEFLPSGVTTAKLQVSSSIAYSTNYDLVLVMRTVLTVLVALLFVINVLEISKVGFKNYVCELHGFIKSLVFLSGVLVVVSTFHWLSNKYARIDTLFRRTIEQHTDIHRVHSWELADSLAISTFVLAICSELTVVVRNAFGVDLLVQGTSKGFRIVLSAFLMLIFISRTVEVSLGLKLKQKFALFFELQLRLLEIPQFLYLTRFAQIVCLLILIATKACTAINIYYFINTEPSPDTAHIRTVRILRRHLPKRKRQDLPPTRVSQASTRRSQSSKESSASSGEQKIESRSDRLWSKVQSLGNIWGNERE